MNFKLDPEIQALLPELTAEELALLSQQIRSGGHVDSIVVLNIRGDRILGDGHNRLRICEEHGIPYVTREVQLASREAAIQWVIDNQLGRRNLTDERRAYYMGKEYLCRKQAHGGQDSQASQGEKGMGQNVPSPSRTSQEVADRYGVDEKTVRRNAEFAQAVDEIGAHQPAAKEAILNGQSGLTKSQVVNDPKAAKVCNRCERAGPVRDCPTCRRLRQERKPMQSEREPGDDTEQIQAEENSDPVARTMNWLKGKANTALKQLVKARQLPDGAAEKALEMIQAGLNAVKRLTNCPAKPPGKGKCKKCGMELLWVTTENHIRMAVNSEPGHGGEFELMKNVAVAVEWDGTGTQKLYKAHCRSCPKNAH